MIARTWGVLYAWLVIGNDWLVERVCAWLDGIAADFRDQRACDLAIHGVTYSVLTRNEARELVGLRRIPPRDVVRGPIAELPHAWAIWNMVVIGFCVGAVLGSAWVLFGGL